MTVGGNSDGCLNVEPTIYQAGLREVSRSLDNFDRSYGLSAVGMVLFQAQAPITLSLISLFITIMKPHGSVLTLMNYILPSLLMES